jgi:hypothetical protein
MRYEAPKGKRIKRVGFWDVTNFEDYHWADALNRWVHRREIKSLQEKHGDFDYGTHCYGIKSVRTFRRRVKKWSKYLPKGIEFILVPRWVGHHVYMRTK